MNHSKLIKFGAPHPTGGYRRHFGRSLSGSKKAFYFGKDLATAQRKALAIAAVFEDMKVQTGNDVWQDQWLVKADSIMAGQLHVADPIETSTISVVPPNISFVDYAREAFKKNPNRQAVENRFGGLRFHAAIDGYRSKILSEPGRRRVTRIWLAKRLDTLKRLVEDVPLSELDHDRIEKILDLLVSRPHRMRNKKLSEERMAFNSLRDLMQAFKSVLEYLDASSGVDYDLPKGFHSLLKQKRSALARACGDADDDSAPDSVKKFTIEELARIWAAADNPRRRLYFLLALNCGFRNTDLATLRCKHLHLDSAAPYIARRRHKVKAQVKKTFYWRLWDETADALRQHLADPKTEELLAAYKPNEDQITDPVFLTENSNLLVEAKEKSVNDAVKLVWQRWARRAKVGNGGFKRIRSTGSQFIRNIGGAEMADAYLAHKDRGSLKNYSDADFKRLGKCLMKIRKNMKFLDEPANPPKTP